MNNFPTASPLKSHFGYWIRQVSNSVSNRFQKLLETEGVSVTEWVALRILLDQKHTTHSELIYSIGLTKGATSKVISRLEEKKLVKRTLAKGSAREQLIILTVKGRALVPRLALLADQNEEHFFGHLDPAIRGKVMKIFQSLVDFHNIETPPLE
jgi:DNA-binding MarR family transcriptional regulator